MNTSIAFLRGINVGGRNTLRMSELATMLAGIGLIDVKTYVQSGNVVFRNSEASSTTLETRIENAIRAGAGIDAKVVVLSVDELESGIATNSFPHAESAPSTLHLFFLSNPPQNPNVESLNKIKASSESIELTDRVFYLHAPDGIGRSKLAASVERLLGVGATARNWRTVTKVAEMAYELG